jgi:hypothetical protein
MVSALLALVELKRAHWMKGVYFIFSVLPNPRLPTDTAKDTILACNLSRQIPFVSPSQSSFAVPTKIQSQLEDVGFSGNCVTGTWDSADGRIKCKLHNGGPVNWSQCHYALLTSLPTSLSLGDLNSFIETVRKRSLEESDGENGDMVDIEIVPKSKLGESPPPLAVFGSFFQIVDLANLIGEDDDSTIFEIKSFAGYAKWGRVQLLREFCRDSWGAVYDGPPSMVKTLADPPAVSTFWEGLLSESSQFIQPSVD